MQHATSISAPAPVAGIDWATDTNALCVVDPDGQILTQLQTPADAAGIRRLVATLDRHRVTQVAIERPDGPVVEALLAAGRTVVVIAPRQVHHLRTRSTSAATKHDRFDA
jgi:transposase